MVVVGHFFLNSLEAQCDWGFIGHCGALPVLSKPASETVVLATEGTFPSSRYLLLRGRLVLLKAPA
jgi:hypothetical protein